MGLKGYRLWVMGQLDSNVQSLAAMHYTPASQARSNRRASLHCPLAANLRAAQQVVGGEALGVATHTLTHVKNTS
jgi:hypothetical protein